MDGYWQTLRENLAGGRIRLMFVADRIPSELLAVVESLNAHMDHTEVLAVEIPQFIGEGLRTLAPRVLGQTQQAIQNKGGARASRRWDEASVFALMESKLNSQEVGFARRYFDWVTAQGWHVSYGRGSVDGSFTPTWTLDGQSLIYPMTCYTFGRCEFRFAWMMESPPFDRPEMRIEFVRRLGLPPGEMISDEAALSGKYPKVSFSAFTSEESFNALTQTILWYEAEVESAARPSAEVGLD